MMQSFIIPLLAFVRITVRGGRWLFGFTILLLLVTLLMYRDMMKAGEILALTDFAYLAVIGFFALLFAWLGFTASGKILIAKSSQDEVVAPQLARVIKVLFASMGMAVGIWLVLIVLSLIVGGPDWVSAMFLPWVLALLTAICFPFAYKWLKTS